MHKDMPEDKYATAKTDDGMAEFLERAKKDPFEKAMRAYLDYLLNGVPIEIQNRQILKDSERNNVVTNLFYR